jgi:DNA-binding NarL/FixJ family response regulator
MPEVSPTIMDQMNTFILAGDGISVSKMAFLNDSDFFKSAHYITRADQLPVGKNAKNQPDLIIICLDGALQDNVLVIPWIKKKCLKAKVLVCAQNFSYDIIKTSFLMGADGFIGKEECEKTIERMILQNITQGIPAVTQDAVAAIVQKMQGDKLLHEAADRLSVKQKTIAKLLVRGYSYIEIAEQLNQSIDLVRYHIKQIYSKLGIKTKIQLMSYVELD